MCTRYGPTFSPPTDQTMQLCVSRCIRVTHFQKTGAACSLPFTAKKTFTECFLPLSVSRYENISSQESAIFSLINYYAIYFKVWSDNFAVNQNSISKNDILYCYHLSA